MGDQQMVTEIPSSLKQLARLVVRAFYTPEDALIIDILVRHPCKWPHVQLTVVGVVASIPEFLSLQA